MSIKNVRYRIQFFLFLMLVGISGYTCGSAAPEQQAPTIVTTENEGLAVLKVVVPATIKTALTTRWQKLEISGVETGKAVTFTSQGERYENYSLFIAKLPAGKYKLTAVSSTNTTQASGGVQTSAASLKLDGGRSFEVVGGHISDLGTLLTLPGEYGGAHRQGSWRHYQDSQNTQILHTRSPIESAQLMRVIQQKAPALAILDDVRVWGVTENVKLSEIPRLTQNSSAKYYAPLPLSSGEMYAGEEVGQIRQRDTKGEWSWLNTGLTSAISSLDVLDDGSLLAGARHGIIMQKKKDSDQWIGYPLPFPDFRVVAISHGSRGVTATLYDGYKLIVISTPELKNNPQWSEMKGIDFSGSSGTAIRARTTKSGFSLLTTTVGWSMKSKVYHYDDATKLWADVPLATNWSGTTGITDLAQGGTIFQALGKTMHISADNGKSWTEFPTPGNNIQILQMLTEKVGYTQKLEAITGGNEYKVSLWQTTDGAKTWTNFGMLPSRLANIFEINPHELAAKSLEGKYFRSKDGGQSWTEVFYFD